MLYGAEHPLGAVVTEASLEAITLDDCKKYVGDVAQAEATRGCSSSAIMTEAQIARRRSTSRRSRLDGRGAEAARAARAEDDEGPDLLRARAERRAVEVMMLQFGPKRTAADYFANTMMAAVFGGGFTSRINMNLREDKGYSYGARGGFSYSEGVRHVQRRARRCRPTRRTRRCSRSIAR